MKKLTLSMILGLISFEALGVSLHNACQGYDKLKVKEVIRLGADLNERNSSGQTPLIYVATFRFYTSLAAVYAEELLRAGASVNCQDNQGNTALHNASDLISDYEYLVSLLLEYGANPNIKNKQGCTALHIAKDTQILKDLLKFGAIVNIKDNNGQTPLHIASKYGRTDCVVVLLQSGADVSIVDKYGHTAADVCCSINGTPETKFTILSLLKNNK